MKTGGGDVVEMGVRMKRLLVGWSGAQGLIDCDHYWDFREIVKAAHYASDSGYRRAGHAAGQLWNFVHEIRVGDLVVVPHGPMFYVGEVTGPAEEFDDDETWAHDIAHRRPVRWLNDGEAVPRTNARAPLIARMRAYGTVTAAGDLVQEVEDAVASLSLAEAPTLLGNLRQRLIDATKKELQTGHLDERRFELLVRDLLLALGAVDAHVVARRLDIGADIQATFSVGQLTTIPVQVQVKYWRGKANRKPIDQLLNAMDEVQLGVVVTTATFSDDAQEYAATRSEETGKQLVLVDGDELSRLIVEHGLGELLGASKT
jgi:predicted Mrr-cat superfamily restriction endonuclease